MNFSFHQVKPSHWHRGMWTLMAFYWAESQCWLASLASALASWTWFDSVLWHSLSLQVGRKKVVLTPNHSQQGLWITWSDSGISSVSVSFSNVFSRSFPSATSGSTVWRESRLLYGKHLQNSATHNNLEGWTALQTCVIHKKIYFWCKIKLSFRHPISCLSFKIAWICRLA